MKFTELNLPASLQTSIAKVGFTDATPIQEKTIPLALEGKDIIGSAQTGTGKTAAFLIPILSKLIQNPQAKALVMAPTRELAEQVQKVAFELSGPGTNVRSAILIGGVSFVPQFRMLRYNPQLIVATPGRLIDHCQNNPGLLRNVKFLVLDEADRMLDMGFMPQIQEVMKMLSAERQTLLFSATLSKSIRALAGTILKDPVQVETTPQAIAAPQIEQKTVDVQQQQKNQALVDLLTAFQGSVLVFAKTQMRTEKVSKHLNTLGFSSETIHGGKSQAKRKAALDLFRKKQVQILVATDVAARGLDIDHVEQVVNFDLPMDPEDYVHRIGRTGRAGRSGLATSLISTEERRMWSSIQRLLKMGNSTEKFASEERPRGFRPFKREESSAARPGRNRFGDRREGGRKNFDRGERKEFSRGPGRSAFRDQGFKKFDSPKDNFRKERRERFENEVELGPLPKIDSVSFFDYLEKAEKAFEAPRRPKFEERKSRGSDSFRRSDRNERSYRSERYDRSESGGKRDFSAGKKSGVQRPFKNKKKFASTHSKPRP